MSDKDNSKGEGLKGDSEVLMEVQHVLREAQFALQTMIEWAEKGDIPNAIALNMKRGKLIEIDRAFSKSYNLKPHPESPLVGLDEDEIAFLIFKNLCNYSEETARTQWTGKHYVKVEKSIASRTAKAICARFGSPQKDDPRFVEVGKIIWPDELECSRHGYKTIMGCPECGSAYAINETIKACKAAALKAGEKEASRE